MHTCTHTQTHTHSVGVGTTARRTHGPHNSTAGRGDDDTTTDPTQPTTDGDLNGSVSCRRRPWSVQGHIDTHAYTVRCCPAPPKVGRRQCCGLSRPSRLRLLVPIVGFSSYPYYLHFSIVPPPPQGLVVVPCTRAYPHAGQSVVCGPGVCVPVAVRILKIARKKVAETLTLR